MNETWAIIRSDAIKCSYLVSKRNKKNVCPHMICCVKKNTRINNGA